MTGAIHDVLERRRLEHELRHTLSHDSFLLHYQPTVALACGATIGGEALLRWPHRRRGIVAPALFLPVAERSGLGAHIGGWVLRAACAEAARWPAQTRVSVNISPRHLAEGILLEHVAAALQSSGLDPERLQLEMPEPALLDPSAEVLLTLAALRDFGVELAFDNFGAGHASLGVLWRVPLSSVKLDRCLLRSLPRDPDDAAIVEAVVETGHALGLRVEASGIETCEQRDFLSRLGCCEAQGHLFSPALTAEEIRSRFTEHAGPIPAARP